MSEVILKNVSKIYDSKNIAVKDVNINIEDKQFVVLVGPSGCGKSTILRMIAGLEEVTSGEIYIDGKLVNNTPPKDRDIAMVFQNYALYPHMTVFENMAFGLKIRKFDKNEIKERVFSAAKVLGLEDLLDRKPKALSGGQRQRVALGRAIVRKPKVFLFDEPLSNLDAKLRVQMRTEISRLHNKLETTMIYVTHDQTEAMTMGDKIVILKGGIVQQIDNPINLYNKPVNKFVASFIGSPAMNFIDCKIISENENYYLQATDDFQILLSSEQKLKLLPYLFKNILIGIRPEHFILSEDSSGLEITPEVVEQLGNEVIIYFNIANTSLVARFPSNYNIKSNKSIYLKFDKEKFHFFDPQSESVI